MAKRTITTQERDEAVTKLRAMLKPGDKVYTITRRVAASGMSRIIDLACIVPVYDCTYPKGADGFTDYTAKPKKKLRGHEVVNIGWLAGRAGVAFFDADKGGLLMRGCGMDFRFEAVYRLGCILFPDGGKDRTGENRSGGYLLQYQPL